jgi:predicted short-subunit dehydrogenase-like oxidoreductase (DUF2520 family)
MDFENKINVTVIGCGNVGTHFCKSFLQERVKIVQVINRTEFWAKKIAQEVKADFSIEYNSIPENTDYIVICVKDKEIENVIDNIPIGNYTVIHTSGTVSLEVFKNKFKKFGVVYPLQTFTKEKSLKLKTVPFFIESNSKENLQNLKKFALAYSANIWEADSAKRKKIHLAAVFSCNFVNHLLVLSKEILKTEEIPLEILHPLIKETIEKALLFGPEKVQTGPAVRGDDQTMKLHLELLADKKDIQTLYKLISQSIIEKHYDA